MSLLSEQAQALQPAIKGLYKAFARYPLRSRVEGCPHCVSADDNTVLHSRPLEQLGAGDLSRYAFKAMSTWGDDEDFRHFLPRLLELLAFDPHLAINPEILIGKLHDARWRSWPGEEQRAIEAYLAATWRAVLASYSSMRPYWDAGTGLCAIAQAADDLAAYLDHWRQDRSMVGRHHLANFVNSSTPKHSEKVSIG